MWTRRTFGLVLVVIIGAFFLYAFNHAQALEDWWRLRGYSPPAAIAAFTSEDTMTPTASHIFYVTHPKLEADGKTFSHDCPQSEQTIVLGCYQGELSLSNNQNNIFVYDVNDSRLHGVQQVTAAHEMLHAAYDRLNAKDKVYINGLLMNFFNNNLKDQRVINTINAYKTSEPNDVVNEMHSVFGTEVADLPAALEHYYQRYFSNRQAVVAFADSYEAEFTNRIAEINVFDQQLASLKQKISQEEENLKTQQSAIEAVRAKVENSQDNNQIDAYNNQVNAYNGGVKQLQNDIATYNNLVEQRNRLAVELRSLQSALDTRLSPQPAQ